MKALTTLQCHRHVKFCGALFLLSIVVAMLTLTPATAAQNESKALQIWTVSDDSESSGTGFFINQSGDIVTNHHVIDGGKKFYALPDGFSGGPQTVKSNYAVELVWSSSDLDLALLRPMKETLHHLHILPLVLTNNLPSKGSRVKAIGFPGVADDKNMESSDLNANATITSGDLGRLIEAGIWRSGGVPLQLVQHSAFIHRGNSGGPLLDSCGRVVGINTQGNVHIVTDGTGKGTGIGDLTAGYYYASDVRELIKALQNQDIDFVLDSSRCVSSNERFQAVLRNALVAGSIGFVLLTILVIYAFKTASGKQQMERIIETYSRRSGHSNKSAGPTSRMPPVHRPVENSSGANLILDGYGSYRNRLIIDQADLSDGEVIVGREPGDSRYTINDPDESVSRQHAALYLSGGRLFVRDLDSTNGTYINGQKLRAGEASEVAGGDDLKLGSVSFKCIAG